MDNTQLKSITRRVIPQRCNPSRSKLKILSQPIQMHLLEHTPFSNQLTQDQKNGVKKHPLEKYFDPQELYDSSIQSNKESIVVSNFLGQSKEDSNFLNISQDQSIKQQAKQKPQNFKSFEQLAQKIVDKQYHSKDNEQQMRRDNVKQQASRQYRIRRNTLSEEQSHYTPQQNNSLILFPSKQLISVKTDRQAGLNVFKRVNESSLSTTNSDEQHSYDSLCNSLLEDNYQLLSDPFMLERCQNPHAQDIQFKNIANNDLYLQNLISSMFFQEDIFN